MATQTAKHTSCYNVSNQIVKLAKEFAGRNELDGYWTDDQTFWGTKNAVNMLKAWADGYFARCVETNPNLRK